MAGITRRRERGTMDYFPDTAVERIAAFREVLDKKSYAKIDGTMIDLTTANIVVQVYNTLSDDNKQKFAKHKSYCMASIAFKMVSK